MGHEVAVSTVCRIWLVVAIMNIFGRPFIVSSISFHYDVKHGMLNPFVRFRGIICNFRSYVLKNDVTSSFSVGGVSNLAAAVCNISKAVDIIV
jgi:formate/nitrite transporter FocA (FNT family)